MSNAKRPDQRNSWNDERRARLRKLWANRNYSTDAIAKALNDEFPNMNPLTCGAVAGARERMGLPLRTTQQVQATRGRRDGTGSPYYPMLNRLDLQRRSRLTGLCVEHSSPAARIAAERLQEQREARMARAPRSPLQGTMPAGRGCRWPVGAACLDEDYFCRAPVHHGSYCTVHYEMSIMRGG
jgi:hypothetical protein